MSQFQKRILWRFSSLENLNQIKRMLLQIFKDFVITLTPSCRSPYHIETSPLICKANQWTGFCMIGTFVMKELAHFMPLVSL